MTLILWFKLWFELYNQWYKHLIVKNVFNKPKYKLAKKVKECSLSREKTLSFIKTESLPSRAASTCHCQLGEHSVQYKEVLSESVSCPASTLKEKTFM